MSFDFGQEKERIDRERQLLLREGHNVVQGEAEESRKLIDEAYRIAQQADMEDLLLSARNSPWKVGEVTSGEEANRRYVRLSYTYEAPQVEEGVTGSRLRYGTYVTQGVNLTDTMHIQQRTGLHREAQHGVLSWTTQEVATTLEVGAMLLGGKPHIYVYDSAEDLRGSFHDAHPREVPTYQAKNFVYRETDQNHFGQALEVTPTTDINVVQDFLRDNILASCIRRQQDGKLPTNLALASQTRIATLPSGKRH